MIDLVFPAPRLSALIAQFRQECLESCVVMLAVPVRRDLGWRLLVREVHVAPPEAYEIRTEAAAHLKTEFLLPLEKRAVRQRWSLIYCHSHPWQSVLPYFSPIDDKTDRLTSYYLNWRIPNLPHLTLLIGREQVRARALNASTLVRVIEVGRDLVFHSDPNEPMLLENAHNRQILLFGEAGQQLLGRLRVGVVGLGGTGSGVVQQLAHLGINSYLLIDKDIVEDTNLNRMPGAEPDDVGRKKTEIAERLVRRVRPLADITPLPHDVLDPGIARRLLEADFIFCCTDSHGSRNLLNQLAYQYLIPCIDMGVAIQAENGRVIDIGGRAQMLAPTLGCLTCQKALDPNEVRQELLNEVHRRADPYFSQGSGVKQPAVISINSTAVSLAMTMFLGAVTGIPVRSRLQFYDAMNGKVSSARLSPEPHCITCSDEGALAQGDAPDWPLPARTD